MIRFRASSFIALASAAVLTLGVVGCGSDSGKDKTTKTDDTVKDGSKPTPTTLEPLAAKEYKGVLKGKITFDGTKPEPKAIDVSAHKDKDICSGTVNETWVVDDNGGVANVFVWIRAPKGKFFNLPDELKSKDEIVKIDQPKCAFEPHAIVMFPSAYDAATKKQKPTGQKLNFVNSATIAHNTNWSYSDTLLNKGDNKTIEPGGKIELTGPYEVRACKETDAGKEQKLTVTCDVHKWMKGYGMIFDHPFAAVTGKDGSFEIKNVPVDGEVEFVYWHESMDKPVAKKVKLKAENDETFKIK